MSDNNNLNHEANLSRFTSLLSSPELVKLIALQDQPLPAGIRINRLKMDPLNAIQDLSHRYGWLIKQVPFCENGWTIHAAETAPGITIEHRLGNYYLQDAASMVPVSLFEFSKQHPIILDMAASPGGKTTHLIDRTLDQSFIIANDSSSSRIPALRSVLSNWGGANQIVTQFPGESFGRWFPEMFDYVLLDAPCSMENLRPTTNNPVRDTTIDERLRLQTRQVDLLISGLASLKPEGQMVYATCSLAPEEDEAVIDAVLKQFPGVFSVDKVSEQLPFNVPGITRFGLEDYHLALKHALRLWPHLTGMSGFFCARMTKLSPMSAQTEPPPTRDFTRTGLQPLENKMLSAICETMFKNYGLNLIKILENYSLEAFQRYDQLFLIPNTYLDNFQSLPFTLIGLLMGQWQDGMLKPSAEFISRFGRQFTHGMIQIDDDLIPQWISGRDIRHLNTNIKPIGQYLLVTDSAGRNLGLGKLLPNRLRNMLPR